MRHTPLGLALLALPLTAPAATGAEDRVWTGEGELGLSTTSGNTDTSTLTARLAGDREGKRMDLHLLGEGRYSREEGEATSQRAHGRAQLDYRFNARDYAYGVFEATHDKFSGYRLRLQEGVGLGRRFFLTHPELDWRVEAGPSLRQDWRTDDTYDATPNLRLRTLFEWGFREGAELSQELTWTHSLENTDRYTASSETAVAFRLNSRLAFKTSLQVEHDSLPPSDTERTDLFTTTSLLYTF
jgi:putative salt-induced outer membrane protein YdiY